MTAPTRAALLDLATRCEQTSGPDRELDFAIFRVLHPEYAGPEWKPYGSGLRHVNDSSDMRCLPPPELTPSRWTASLDAALTLVPIDHTWQVGDCGEDGDPSACVTAPDDWFTDYTSAAVTPALALCAAALRALAAEASHE